MSTLTSPVRTRAEATQLLGHLALLIAAMGVVKFVGLAHKHGIEDSPYGFLLVLVAPFLVGRLLLGSRPRAAAGLIGLFAAGFATLVTVRLAASGLPLQFWGDYLVVFVGGPAAVLAVLTALRVLGRRR